MNLTKPAALATMGGFTLGLALACGGIGSGPDGSVSRGYDDYPKTATGDGAYGELDQAYQVAPDRALVGVDVSVNAPSHAESIAALDAKVSAIQAAMTSGGTGCSARVLDYTTPDANGDVWSSAAEVRVDIDLRQLADVEARRARIDACLAPLDPLLTRREWRKMGGSTERLGRSSPIPSVAAPDDHRDRLLERERARLGWAAAATGAPQLHPEDLRCVPDGTVRIGPRRLSGVVLTLGMDCRIGVAAPAVAATE